MTVAAPAWSALHVHLPHSMQTAFVRDVAGPVLRGHRWFFLRYWQGGPHLRIRVDGASTADLDGLRAALLVPELTRAQAREYEEAVRYQAPLAELEDEDEAPAWPPGTVTPVPYQPEYAKYGGPAGVAVAEDLFCATSTAVVDLLAQRTDTQAPVGDAVRVVAMSLHGSGLDIASSAAFLRDYESWWLRYVPPGHDAGWPALHARLAPQVRALCEAVYVANRPDPFRTIYADALTAAAHAAAAPPDVRTLLLAGTPYRRCLANYIHTTNNRIGIVPGAEAFIAKALHQALTDLTPERHATAEGEAGP